jgi:isopentenyl-diphosphate Delta-isomerase
VVHETQPSLVELVDESGYSLGSATVTDAHAAPGRLHRAFSVLLLDLDGRMLLQQRSRLKSRFALRWANACCGHPAPGEAVAHAATRRLAEELGVNAVTLVEVGVYRYRAEDPQTGRVEDEYDHVLVGHTGAAAHLAPDPAEVADVRWVNATAVVAAARAEPDSYAPWLAGVVALLPAARARGLCRLWAS